MTNRKFYKTTFTIEVLSEEEIGSVSLEDLSYMITEGDCSGHFTNTKVKELNGKQAANALLNQGSDPEFFRIDENGNDIDDEIHDGN